MKIKLFLARCLFISVIWFSVPFLLFCQTEESISDTISTKPSFQKRIFLFLKTGPVFLQPPAASGIKAGLALNASISFHLGKNFYLKPVFSFWQVNYKTDFGNQKNSIPVTGVFAEVEYIIPCDKIAFPIGLGLGSCSYGGDGMFAFLMEAGVLYKLNDIVTLYFGSSYQPCAEISLGEGEGKSSFAPAMVYAGLRYRIK